MQHFIIVDPTSGRGIAQSSTTAPGYQPGEHEAACSLEQYANPTGWALVDGELQEADPLPPVRMGPVITYKADLYRRCTDEEADAIEMALAAAPVRKRRLFEEAQYLDHSDEAFAFAQEALVGMFGQKRADDLLAAS